MKNIILLIVLTTIFIGCSSMNEDYLTKLDTELRTELKESQTKDSEVIGFFGKCNNEITQEMKDKINSTGAKIETTIKDIFTASGTLGQIVEVAKLDFIKSLEKSKQSFPNNL
jgi:hypothetical protein